MISIEKRLDEIATLYDCLFDREIYCGLQIFTEERRCYRLTKQAFINLSHGERLRRGEQAPTVTTPQTSWRHYSHPMEQEATSGVRQLDHWRRSQSVEPSPQTASQELSYNNRQQGNWRIGGGLRDDRGQKNQTKQANKPKLFVNQKYLESLKSHVKENDKQEKDFSLRPNNLGSPNVQKFFSAYQPGKKQQVQSPLPPNQPSTQPQTANMEFQAIWKHLQKQKLPEPALPHPGCSDQPGAGLATPPAQAESSCDPDQTNALKRILRLDNGLNAQAQQQKLWPAGGPQPSQSERPCGHEKACESVLADICRQLGSDYPEIAQRPSSNRNGIMAFMTHGDLPEGFINSPECTTQTEAVKAVTCLAAKKLEQKIKERHLHQLLQMKQLSLRPPQLPTPPQQWCQMPPQHPPPLMPVLASQSHQNKQRGFQPLFVPSQVQGYHPVSTFHRPMNHHHYRNQVNAHATATLTMAAPVSQCHPQEPTSFGEPRRNAVPTPQQQQHFQQLRPLPPQTHGPRPKSRIAAVFSTPIARDEQ